MFIIMFGLSGVLIYQMYKRYFYEFLDTENNTKNNTASQTELVSDNEKILQLERRVFELEYEIKVLHNKYSCDIRDLRESNSELINTFIVSNYDIHDIQDIVHDENHKDTQDIHNENHKDTK